MDRAEKNCTIFNYRMRLRRYGPQSDFEYRALKAVTKTIKGFGRRVSRKHSISIVWAFADKEDVLKLESPSQEPEHKETIASRIPQNKSTSTTTTTTPPFYQKDPVGLPKSQRDYVGETRSFPKQPVVANIPYKSMCRCARLTKHINPTLAP